MAVGKQRIGALPPPTDEECGAAIYSIYFEKKLFIFCSEISSEIMFDILFFMTFVSEF